MKILPTVLIGVLSCLYSCSDPCSKKENVIVSKNGKISFVIRDYPNCADSLTYFQREFYWDTILGKQGNVKDGIKEGLWKSFIQSKNESGEIKQEQIEEYYENGEIVWENWLNLSTGTLESETKKIRDSTYVERIFWPNGNLRAVSTNVGGMYLGYLSIEQSGELKSYDSLGNKEWEGMMIPHLMIDTIHFYEEYTGMCSEIIIEDLVAKQGLWYHFHNGTIDDSVFYDKGIFIWGNEKYKFTWYKEEESGPCPDGIGSLKK